MGRVIQYCPLPDVRIVRQRAGEFRKDLDMGNCWREIMFMKDHRKPRETVRRTLGHPIRAAGVLPGQRKRIKSGHR